MRRISFRGRILASAVVTPFLAVFTLWSTITVVLQRLPPPVISLPGQVLEACRDDPQRWSELSFGEARVVIFDGQGRSISGDVLPKALQAIPVGSTALDMEGDAAIHRHTADGPCAYARMEFRSRSFDYALPMAAALGLFLAVLAVALASYVFTLVPLLVRIEHLRHAADGVGSETYTSASDLTDDDLGAIGAVLDASQARIAKDRQELLSRHQALEQYLAEIAHDLRTPLGSMLLALQEVHHLVRDSTASEASRRALSDVGYVTTLVDNLHQAARLRHGLEPARGTADLADVVQRIEIRFRALGSARDVQVGSSTPETSVWVDCEPSLLERAVANLVDNSMSHGAKNVAVLLDAVDDQFVLQVDDDGPGIEPAKLADLSARTFLQDDARQRGPHLGLAITNEVVRRAGWTISFTHPEEGGLRVTIMGARRLGAAGGRV